MIEVVIKADSRRCLSKLAHCQHSNFRKTGKYSNTIIYNLSVGFFMLTWVSTSVHFVHTHKLYAKKKTEVMVLSSVYCQEPLFAAYLKSSLLSETWQKEIKEI